MSSAVGLVERSDTQQLGENGNDGYALLNPSCTGCPTHHSTGPARKAAQAGEFKRYASQGIGNGSN